MTPEYWREVRELFGRICDMNDDGREQVLKGYSNPELTSEVRRLLANLVEAGSFLEPPTRAFLLVRDGSPPALRVGDRLLSRFEVVRLLGRGGMGEVYEALDHTVGERIALKTVRPELVSDPAALIRLRDELRRARRVSHYNVCRLNEFFETNASRGSVAFLTMELLEGETLAARLARLGQMDFDTCVSVLSQIALGLEAAHSSGILHRDLKPSNIFLVGRDDSIRVVVTDFGLAYSLSNRTELMTGKQAIQIIGGTPGYMAPEQFGPNKLTTAVDVYAMGMIANEALHRGSVNGRSKVFRFRRLNRCNRAVAKATKANPIERYQTPSAFVDALQKKGFQRNLPSVAIAAILVCAALLMVPEYGFEFLGFGHEQLKAPLPPIPFTSYPGYQRFPSFSPEGTRVAFTWERPGNAAPNIYLKLIGPADPVRLTTDANGDFGAVWSPDGEYIAFLRAKDLYRSALMVMSATGGQERELTTVTRESWRLMGSWNWSVPAPFLAWSKDGKWLLSLDQSSPLALSYIVRVSFETGDKIPLTKPPSFSKGDGSIEISPDGQKLAFTRTLGLSASDVYSLSLTPDLRSKGSPHRLTFDGREIYGLAWRANGDSLVFSSARGGQRELWQVSESTTGKPTRVGATSDEPADVAISRKGNYLVYSHPLEDENIWRIPLQPNRAYSVSAFISSTRREHAAKYSPDGKYIAFESNRSGSEQIWICDADGSNPRQLTEFTNASAGSPRWSPDGNTIAFDCDVLGNWDIYIVSSGRGVPRRLTSGQANEIRPSWSRDGKWIYYASDRSNRYQIYKIPSMGGIEIEISKTGGVVAFESNEGDLIYFSESNELKVVPKAGGAERLLSNALLHQVFSPARAGIYFFDKRESTSTSLALKILDPRTGLVKNIGRFPGPLGHDDLTVSADGRWLLYDKMDRAGSEMMLVRNFH